jgi:hypothetical protein
MSIESPVTRIELADDVLVSDGARLHYQIVMLLANSRDVQHIARMPVNLGVDNVRRSH